VDARQSRCVVRSANKFASMAGSWLARQLGGGRGVARSAPELACEAELACGSKRAPAPAGEQARRMLGWRDEVAVVARVARQGRCCGVSGFRDFFSFVFFFCCPPVSRLVLGDSKKLQGGASYIIVGELAGQLVPCFTIALRAGGRAGGVYHLRWLEGKSG
jgi:hypothetical protein